MIGDPFDWQLLLINNGRDWLDTLDTACGKRTNHGELYESCYITEDLYFNVSILTLFVSIFTEYLYFV